MFEEVIIANLMANEEYARKVIPFLKDEYFHAPEDRALYSAVSGYINRYNKVPDGTTIRIELDNNKRLGTKEYQAAVDKLESASPAGQEIQWLIDETEKFCKDKALYNALMESIQVAQGDSKNLSRGGIPKLLSDAIAVSFDTEVGHDYLEDIESRFSFYHSREERIPTHLDILNTITKGGFPRKTLNVFMASTGVGKSMIMCDIAANMLVQGKNILYITLEMAEERIAERIDANLLDVALDVLQDLPHDSFVKKIERLKSKTTGRLIIKEYPTGSAGANNFRYLLEELRVKKNFVPDAIFIDYLNICSSSRMKMGGSVNSYQYIKSIAEELRGLAVEYNVPVFSATQTNRSGYEATDVGLDATSESFGLPMTVDFMIALLSTEQLEQMNQLLWKQLKNRYTDINGKFRRFVTGIERSKMKTYDLEESAQAGLVDDSIKPRTDAPAFDKSKFGQRSTPKKFDVS